MITIFIHGTVTLSSSSWDQDIDVFLDSTNEGTKVSHEKVVPDMIIKTETIWNSDGWKTTITEEEEEAPAPPATVTTDDSFGGALLTLVISLPHHTNSRICLT